MPAGQKWPTGHVSHEMEPKDRAKEPAAQGEHEVAPAAAKVPAGHSEQTAGAVLPSPACEKPLWHVQPPAAVHVAALSAHWHALAHAAVEPGGQAVQGGEPPAPM